MINDALNNARTGQLTWPYEIPAPLETTTIKPINPNQRVKKKMVFSLTIETAKS